MSSQVSSDSETDSQKLSQIQHNSKQVFNNFRSWKFSNTIQADILEGELEERKQLVEHIGT